MPEHNKPEYWIANLNLLPHPEGGFYKEVFRSERKMKTAKGMRSVTTSIYYLLPSGEFSAFHRLTSDETWYFHDGYPIELFVISPGGKLTNYLVGPAPGESIYPQCTIPANHWFAARSTGKYTLAGCSVSPGFDFADFEMADRSELLETFPQHAELIRRFTR